MTQLFSSIDEIDDPKARFSEVLASETMKRGFQNSVTASYATAMHSYPNAYASKLIEMLAASGVSVITNPLDNAVLQGRHDDYPRRRGYTRIDELRKAGVPVGIGHDSVMDPVYHYGCADPIDAAYVLIHYAHMSGRGDVETLWQMLTETNAKIFGVTPSEYGLREGNEASLVVFDAQTPFDVLRTRAARKLVFSHGTLIAQSKQDTEVELDGGVTSSRG
jgi:cytosine deaminase